MLHGYSKPILVMSSFPILNQVYSLVNQEQTKKGVNVNSAQIMHTNNEGHAFFSGQKNVINSYIKAKKKEFIAIL